ncbi:hypothetical protein [Streptomyces solaniscabiei]|uniref:hypothetical protein n=1 Tax=Streptomyces solaniscabiei TaxID=2683255 RepID=UPI001CE2A8D5|nr:hypothetical protein [Streptomyces solaniscabiei]
MEQLWPAVIAYAITLAAQEQERPGHRPPWHVLSDSFERGTLAGCFRQLGSSLDAQDLSVCFTLEVGLPVVAEALGFIAPNRMGAWCVRLQVSRLAVGDEPCQGVLQQLKELP